VALERAAAVPLLQVAGHEPIDPHEHDQHRELICRVWNREMQAQPGHQTSEYQNHDPRQELGQKGVMNLDGGKVLGQQLRFLMTHYGLEVVPDSTGTTTS
jgi:hypothetical protein